MRSTKMDQDLEADTPNIKQVKIYNVIWKNLEVLLCFFAYIYCMEWLYLKNVCNLTGNSMEATSSQTFTIYA